MSQVLPGTERAYLWYAEDRHITPSQAAKRFAVEVWGRDRPLLGGGVHGSWTSGIGFSGYFHFEDGNRCYRIECVHGSGLWRVWAE